MIDKYQDKSREFGFYYVVSCDTCSNQEEFEVADFEELMGAMKKAGWYSFKQQDGTWFHKCGAHGLH